MESVILRTMLDNGFAEKEKIKKRQEEEFRFTTAVSIDRELVMWYIEK